MNRLIIVGIVVLAVLASLIPSEGNGQCAFDCHYVWFMGGVSNGTEYCYEFQEPTARLVWSDSGMGMGGTPVVTDCAMGNGGNTHYQDYAMRRIDCPSVCPLNQIPQELYESRSLQWWPLSFECYYCYNP